MLKTVLYYLMLLTTVVRLADMIYVLFQENTNLPMTVVVLTAALILYGLALVFRRFVAPMRLKQYMYFFLVQGSLIIFNLAFVHLVSPLKVSGAETLLMGTFLDLVIACGAVYFCWKRMRVSRSRASYVRFAKGSNA